MRLAHLDVSFGEPQKHGNSSNRSHQDLIKHFLLLKGRTRVALRLSRDTCFASSNEQWLATFAQDKMITTKINNEMNFSPYTILFFQIIALELSSLHIGAAQWQSLPQDDTLHASRQRCGV